MDLAIATRSTQALRWFAPAATVLALAAPAWSQDQAGAAKKDAPPADAARPAAAELPAVLRGEPELFAEPLRQELLRNEFKELSGPVLTDADRQAVLAMAQGQAAVNADAVRKFVQAQVASLTRRSNIAEMLDSSANSQGARRLEEATSLLLRPIVEPASTANAAFRREYARQLQAAAPAVLQGHLHARTFFMVVLAKAKAPELIAILTDAIKDPQQPLTVKMLAAQGLAATAGNGRIALDPNAQAIPAEQAIAGFLNENPDAFWPVQCRMLEALGSLRVASANPLKGEAELAAAAFTILANSGSRPEARAWAGWALGMLTVPGSVQRYNFELVAYEMGRAAADAASAILAIPMPEDQPARNLRLVPRMIEPLLRILSGFVGDPTLRGTGLSNAQHVNAGPAQAATREIEQRVRDVTAAALDLSKTAGGQVLKERQKLESRLNELKAYLARTPPKSAELYPGGPKVELPPAPTGGAAPKSTTAEAKKGPASGGGL